VPIKVVVKDETDEHGQNGFIVQQVDSKLYKKADEEQRAVYNKLPFLGNIKEWEASENDGNVGSMNLTDAPEIVGGDGDDLPF
jgi:hypothetical protein